MEIQLSEMQHCWKFPGTRQRKADFFFFPSQEDGEDTKYHLYPPARPEIPKSLDIIEEEEAENVVEI